MAMRRQICHIWTIYYIYMYMCMGMSIVYGGSFSSNKQAMVAFVCFTLLAQNPGPYYASGPIIVPSRHGPGSDP